MNNSRRKFLKVSTASAMGMLMMQSSSLLAGTHKKFGVGLQLYTIRDAIAEDLEGSLEKVAGIGYENLELANYTDGMFYGKTPKEFRKMMDDFGFKVISSHTSVEAEGIKIETAQKMADAHAELGVEYCVQPWVQEKDRNVEMYKKMVGDWNKVGEVMKNVDIQFGYHNHNFEFANLNGVVPYYDILLKEMDPDLIVLELDLFWATKAGQDPVELFNRYPGRFHLLHLKDMSIDNAPYYTIEKDDITSVGEGLIDFKRILKAKKEGGVKYGFVEDDNQGSGTPFKAIETSFSNLRTDIL
ncbi:MAG TPA: sugar phosphate isomerase/epimerase family protein [Cyclobacteriaceae bacterium]